MSIRPCRRCTRFYNFHCVSCGSSTNDAIPGYLLDYDWHFEGDILVIGNLIPTDGFGYRTRKRCRADGTPYAPGE